ncbi:DUF2975 domain-containing protein [Cellulomonas sp. zg-ZUI222]|uniref:DUF2975 domain-containing protein n=1 Tax=Cellulomonas wangleii TaxID=2816956 RepID=A0ABX8DBS5_9CELL|nr:DUF2975 domain-containing protein [Cellulomonas wangleii]MBO0921420.1 DUF2975 domain-containing protein [Cellulomonas wangleii]MBO0925837.1 DUF2975 domain-containing protein [Cellulomonas wangleii]QVI63647.1 DUF2975 domain-containing protein [Cellulomonas wangleii]
MTTSRRLVLRIALVILLAGSLLLQGFLPVLAEAVGGGYTETERLVVPYALTAIAAVACLQVCLVAGWWLLARARRGELVAPRSLRGVDAATAGMVAATVLAAAPLAHLLVVVGVGGPGVVLALVACVAGGAGLTRVLRSLRADLRCAHTTDADRLPAQASTRPSPVSLRKNGIARPRGAGPQ